MTSRGNKYLSRKFLAAVVGVLFSIVALIGLELEVDKVALVDGLLAIYIVVEGIVDAIRK